MNNPESRGPAKNRAPNVTTQRVEASGLVKIFDKDGNLKSTMKIVSLDLPPLQELESYGN